MRAHVTITALAAATLVLAGCASSDDPAGSTEPEDESVGATTAPPEPEPAADCVVGTWTLDTADLARQMDDFTATTGAMSTTTIDGSSTLEWAPDDRVTLAVDYTVSTVLAFDGAGSMRVDATHTGSAGGTLADVGDGTWRSEDWDASQYVVTTQAYADGVPIDGGSAPVGESGGTGFDTASTIACDGDVLTIHTEPSFATQRWMRLA